MRIKPLLVTIGICLCFLVFSLSLKAAYSHRGRGFTVTVAVQATDTSGGTLTYRWKSTDGTIQNVNAASTTWTVPAGPGLHFSYVLVSNGKGGYTERRIAVNTDTIGTRGESEDDFARVIAPPAPAQVGDYLRTFEVFGDTLTPGHPKIHHVYWPDLVAHAEDPVSGIRYPAAGEVKGDAKGEIVIPGVPPNTTVDIKCSLDGGATFPGCFSENMLSAASTNYIDNSPELAGNPIAGSLRLQDGSLCGTLNEFFGVHASATATLLDAANSTLAGPLQVNEFGDYALLFNPNAAFVRLQCENAVPITVTIAALDPNGTDLGQTTVAGVSAPVISGMTARLRGTLLAPPMAIFLPPPTGFPSDILPRADGYLAEKGLDTRLGACQYYKSVGAVKACDAAGNFVGAITFKDWRHAVRIGEFAVNHVPTFTATYINKVDLNLARVQESITYGPNKTAGVVCNHLGPPANTPDQLVNPSQADIDTAVDNAVNNKNLVACVAMDYTVNPGVNGNQPFTRFLIFGPSGDLLPSVNLDGRREKFVPGTCVVCHGGDHYAGKFPEDGSGVANIGGHFLPYDVGNFEFSSKPGLTEADQETAIFHLNQNVLNSGPTQAELDLIAGWYAGGTTLDKNFTAPSWLATGDATAIDFYRKVVARSCRTCHVALIEPYNFDHYDNVAPFAQTAVFPDAGFDMGINVCGGSVHIRRDHMMPNSLITFNRLWLSSGTADDQPALLQQFYGADTAADGVCPPPVGVLP